ncbi:hypothetical protein ACFE04_013782 [Oxalis oulophora]
MMSWQSPIWNDSDSDEFKPLDSSSTTSTPPSIDCDRESEFDGTSFWESLVNLQGEHSDWKNSETDFGYESDFPSPSYRTPLRKKQQPLFLPFEKSCISMMSLESPKSNGSGYFSDEGQPLDSSTTSTTLSTDSDRKLDFDGTNFWESLVNLEGDDSDWNNSETDSGFETDFSSPSYKASLTVMPEKPQPGLFYELGFDSDQPIFWPLEREFDLNSEDFSMSPRKVISNDLILRRHLTSSEPISTKTRSRIASLKDGFKQNEVKRNTKLARVKSRRLRKDVPLGIPTNGKVRIDMSMKSVNVDTSFLMEDEDLAIEKVTGLCDFDFGSDFSSPTDKTSFTRVPKKPQSDLFLELNFDGDQPLFWPIKPKFDLNSEDFSMSPRKVNSNIQIRRRSLISSEPIGTKTRSRLANLKDGSKHNVVKSNNKLTRPKLRRSSKVVPLDITTDGKVVIGRNLKSLSIDTSFLVEDEDLSIEKLLGLREFGFGSESDFPGPTYKSSLTPMLKKAQFDLFSELDFDGDQPLVWPLERKFDSNYEDFSMSPRKVISDIRNPRRRLTCSEPGRTKTRSMIANLKNGYNKQNAVRKVVPLKIATNGKVMIDKNVKPSSIYMNFLVEDEDPSIEKLLGLCEFDGHEGIDSDFNQDVFFLDDCL